jgi:tetratricopeptide (TPR) repeat protein
MKFPSRHEPILVQVIHRYVVGLVEIGVDWLEFRMHTPVRVLWNLQDGANRDTNVTRYSRQDVIRILHLHWRQLTAWERAGLISHSEQYSFEALCQLRTLRDMQATTRISAKNIRASVDAMQRVAGMRNPLLEASFVRRGSRLSFRHGGALMDPLTQQLAFDFDTSPARQLRVVGSAGDTALRQTAEVQDLFVRAVQLEENPATIAQAVELYQTIIDIRPAHAPALINLGTIHYNLRKYEDAEELYRRATVADPEYALAFFDLGNVLDEMQRLAEATTAYQKAVALVPQYADAHYNLALAYERQGQRRRALRHWLAYVRLDPVGPWANHAKDQARKIMNTEKLSIVSRRGRLVKVAG